jgi:predicted transposase/invertase (TIGR01784 family)
VSERILPTKVEVREVKRDTTFKVVFAEPGAEPRVISFLNAVFQPESDLDKIKSIRFLGTELPSKQGRHLRFDFKVEGMCETYAGNRFIVEMQKDTGSYAHTNRWIYYGARELVSMGRALHEERNVLRDSQARKQAGRTYYERLKPVRVVTILGFDPYKTLLNQQKNVVYWDICERDSKHIASSLMSWAYVILPRFKETILTAGSLNLDFRNDPLSAWLYLLTREDRTEVEVTPELVANDAALAQAYLRLSQLSDDEEQRLIDEQNDEEEAEQMQLQAVQTAKNEGKMEGKMELARNMLADREPLEKIIKYTGLSQDQIESLRTKSP